MDFLCFKIANILKHLIYNRRLFPKPPQYLQRYNTRKQQRQVTFSIAGIECEMPTKASVSKLLEIYRITEWKVWKFLPTEKQKTSLNSYFDK